MEAPRKATLAQRRAFHPSIRKNAAQPQIRTEGTSQTQGSCARHYLKKLDHPRGGPDIFADRFLGSNCLDPLAFIYGLGFGAKRRCQDDFAQSFPGGSA